MRTLDGFGRIVGRGIGDQASGIRREEAITYNASGRIAGVATPEAAVTYIYDSDGSDLGYQIAVSGGVTVARQVVRDPWRKLVTEVDNRVSGISRKAFSCAYDALGRLTVRDQVSGIGDQETEDYVYDSRSQLIAQSTGHQAQGTTYTYDQIGNFAAVTRADAETNFTASAVNQYAGLVYNSDGCLTALPAQSTRHNAQGTLAYDAGCRLTSVSTGGVLVASYAYDPSGRSVKKTTPEAVTRYFYDGWNLIEERETHTNGTVTTTEYVWGRDVSGSLEGAGGVGGLLYVKRGENVYMPLYDQGGNVVAYVDGTTGSLVAEYAYDGFGNTVAASGALADAFRFRYSTKYTDPETGLIYYGYRYYAPSLGRWLTRDPLEEEGGLNLYAFCGNNGVNRYDVDGDSSYNIFDLLSDAWCDDSYRYVLENRLNTPQEKAAWSRYTNHGWRGSSRDINLTSDEVKRIVENADGVTAYVDYQRSRAYSGIDVSGSKSFGGSAPSPWVLAIGRFSANVSVKGKYKCFEYAYKIHDLYDFDPQWICGNFGRSLKNEVKTSLVAVTKACLRCNWQSFYYDGTYYGK